MSAILNSAILDSAILVFPLKLIHTCQDWFPPFAQKNLHSFILTQLDIVSHHDSAMLDSDTAILDSDTLLSSLRFTQKHSHSTLTLTQTNSISSTWWWWPSWILPSWIQPFCAKFWLKLIQSGPNSFILTQLMMAAILNSVILDSAILHKKTSLIHSDSTWWWQPSWILPSWIQTPCILLSDSLKTLWLHSDSDSNLFNLTQTHSFSLN